MKTTPLKRNLLILAGGAMLIIGAMTAFGAAYNIPGLYGTAGTLATLLVREIVEKIRELPVSRHDGDGGEEA